MTEHEPVRTERIRGRLHEMRPIRDGKGAVIGYAPEAMKVEFHTEDLLQLAGGALALALPTAMTEEVWDLGTVLTTGRAALIAFLSIAMLAVYVWALFYRHHVRLYWGAMIRRTVAAYGLALGLSVLVLLLLDQFPVNDLGTGFRRAVLVAWPATISATTVDWLK